MASSSGEIETMPVNPHHPWDLPGRTRLCRDICLRARAYECAVPPSSPPSSVPRRYHRGTRPLVWIHRLAVRTCGDHGVIHGWQDTLWNRGGTPHPPHRSTIDSEMPTVFHRGLKAYLTQFRHRRRSDLARSPPHPGAGLPAHERAAECAGSMSWRSVPSCETRERVLETTAHRHSHSTYISSTYGTNPARVGLRHRISRRIRDLQVHQRGTQRLAMRVERQ
jgi:hypothetical protein